jgi:hypothetical protein
MEVERVDLVVFQDRTEEGRKGGTRPAQMECMKNGYSVAERLEGTAAPDLTTVTPHSFVSERTKRRTFWRPSALQMHDFSSVGCAIGAAGIAAEVEAFLDTATEEEALLGAAVEVEAFLDAAASFLGAIAQGQQDRTKRERLEARVLRKKMRKSGGREGKGNCSGVGSCL